MCMTVCNGRPALDMALDMDCENLGTVRQIGQSLQQAPWGSFSCSSAKAMFFSSKE